MSVFLQHFTYFSQVFVNLGRVKISQIHPKSDIHKRIGQYLLSDSCSNKESDTREFGLYPQRRCFAACSGVSDGRSRYAEPRGRWEGCLYPQRRCFAACSGFQTVGPASRNLGGRWEGCLYPQRRCFAACSGFQMVGPASRNIWGR